jgi:heme-degrading monooxygenase HmoA
MIARLWSARANESHCADYLQHFERSVVPELRKLSGYVGSTVLTQMTNREAEIHVTTLWRSLEAIREFAGPDLETAVVGDEAAALLTSYDHRVRHFEVAMVDGAPPAIL